MPRPKKNDQIELHRAIKETAWRQIAQKGAASLSLRAIARELSITAPAIYNYYTRRDDLVTALIVDAYTEFGDAQFEAITPVAPGDYAGRLRATGLAYRQWAVTHPQRYQLIFGTPIPGYTAPLDKVNPVAARSLTALVSTLDSARIAGSLKYENHASLSPALQRQLEVWKQLHIVGDVYVLYLALVIWSRVHGLVMLEIGNQFPPYIEDPGEIYNREIETIISTYIR